MSNLPNYVKTLDELSNKELGWKSPFDVYYGQKLNSLLKASQIILADDMIAKPFSHKSPKQKDINHQILRM